MISGQNITTFSCQKTNLALVDHNADFNVRPGPVFQQHFKACACWACNGAKKVKHTLKSCD